MYAMMIVTIMLLSAKAAYSFENKFVVSVNLAQFF